MFLWCYTITNVFVFKKEEILKILKNNRKVLGSFDGFLHKQDDLKHSYEKFRFNGNANKPSFDEIYFCVKTYIKSILPDEKF